MTESLTDKVVNSFLYVKSYIRSLLGVTKFGGEEPDKSKMSLVFDDEFVSLDPSNWRIGQPWGLFHPDFPNQYYGFDSVSVRNNKLVLNQIYSPKKFTNDNKTYDIPYSVGLITTYKSFGYGFYEFEVQLPYGVGLWPAVWLGCYDTWPPEIDIIEAYSDANSDYKFRLESNLHFNTTENKETSGARSHPISDPLKNLKLSCWVTKDFIKIYYDGYLVRKTTSEDVLKWFRDKKFMVILNNGVRHGFESNLTEQYSEFFVNYVRVYE
jgi:beta-glucanase (GH16 family)